MKIEYNVVVSGSSVALSNGFIGWSSIVLIKAGSTRILYDCGHHVTRPALLQGLHDKGLKPDNIDILFLSHLHFDHALNFDLFPNSKIMVSNTEWDYADNPHPDDPFVPGYIKAALQDTDLEIFSGEPELADGLRAIHVPGHTPGIYGLEFEAHNERIVIAGDAIKIARELLSEEVSMEFDSEKRGSNTIKKIKERADRIIPGHYPEFRRTDEGWTWDDPQPLGLVFR